MIIYHILPNYIYFNYRSILAYYDRLIKPTVLIDVGSIESSDNIYSETML